MSAEWQCSQCQAWIPAKYLAHFLEVPAPPGYERHLRTESDPIREVEEARAAGPSRWFVVYYAPNSAGRRYGGRWHSIIHSDDQALRWPPGWPKAIFARQVPSHAWETVSLEAMIELYETGRLDRAQRVRIAAGRETP